MYHSDSIISACKLYRYTLSRIWNRELSYVLFIMLNPSTADASKDDQTIKRCISFSKDWGYGGISVVNLYPYRSTDPKTLLKVDNPLGFKNKQYIENLSQNAGIIICAWGNYSIISKLNRKYPDYAPLDNIQKDLHCLKLSKNATPIHPSRLPKHLNPILFKKYE